MPCIYVWGICQVSPFLLVQLLEAHLKFLGFIVRLIFLSLFRCFHIEWGIKWILWVPSIAYEALIFSVTALRARRHSQGDTLDSPILQVFYRDGFLYFLVRQSI